MSEAPALAPALTAPPGSAGGPARRRVVVVGAHCPGLLMRVRSVPRPGETVLGWKLEEPLDGGKATNQAVAAARAGAPVSLVSVVGDDERGRALVGLLADEGIDAAHLELRPGATDIGVVILPEDGIPAIVSLCDRGRDLDAAFVATAGGACRAASVVLCQLEAPQEAAVAAFTLAREGGAVTILNPAPAAPLRPDLIALTDILIPNESEAAELAGGPAPPAELAGQLRAGLGIDTVIVTAGPLGAYASLPGGELLHAPAPPARAVDTTGAGDAFVGTLACALHHGQPLGEAIRLAIAVSSESVTRAGSIPSYPRLTAGALP